jgi:uncharacterized protein
MTRLNWKIGELADGLRLYRTGNFFEAHEHWESVWHRSQGTDKTLLRALIQLAAACHHFERGNRRGTRSLLNAALRRLNEMGEQGEPSQLVELREGLHIWLEALDAAGAIDAGPPAQIRRLKALDHRDRPALSPDR